MRAAQFIKLDGRALKWRIFEPSIISSNLEGPKGVMAQGPVCPRPIDPPNYHICYHMLLQRVHERRLQWSRVLQLVACSHTVCELCISLADTGGDVTNCLAWIEQSG